MVVTIIASFSIEQLLQTKPCAKPCFIPLNPSAGPGGNCHPIFEVGKLRLGVAIGRVKGGYPSVPAAAEKCPGDHLWQCTEIPASGKGKVGPGALISCRAHCSSPQAPSGDPQARELPGISPEPVLGLGLTCGLGFSPR